MKYQMPSKTLPLIQSMLLRPWKSDNWKRMRVEQYLGHFLNRIEPTLHRNTFKNYGQVIRNHIIPQIGSIRLRDLDQNHIQMLHSNLLNNGISPTRVRFSHKVLRRALNLAVRWGYRKDNPAELVTIPKKNRREMKTFSVEEVRIFLDAVKGSRLEALFHLAVTSGLRQSELLGLQWPDLDWETGSLRITRQLQRVRDRGLIFTEPKSGSSRRHVVVGPTTLCKLRKHKENQDIERERYVEEWHDRNLIFTTAKGSPIGPRNLYRKFKSIIRSAGLSDIRFHDLRHTCATMMLQSGVNIKVIQTALGHSSVSITIDTYSHLLPGMQSEAAQMVDNLITKR